jgi:hypothetical protein
VYEEGRRIDVVEKARRRQEYKAKVRMQRGCGAPERGLE